MWHKSSTDIPGPRLLFPLVFFGRCCACIPVALVDLGRLRRRNALLLGLRTVVSIV